MSLEFIDGFDYYTSLSDLTAKWDSNSALDSSAAIEVGQGRFGGNCFFVCGATVLQKTLTPQKTRVIGFAIKFTRQAFDQDRILLAFLDGGTTQMDVRVSPAGLVYVTRNGTELARSSTAVKMQTWFYLEFKVTVDPAAGSFALRLDGVPFLSGSAVNTQTTANATSSIVALYGKYDADADWCVDDLYIANTSGTYNNDFLGACKITASVPNADGSTKTWTPLSGTSNFSQVNTSDGDASYVSTGTPGAIDTYKFPAQALPGAILAVQTVLSQRKTDTGSRVTCAEYRSGAGTNYDGSNQFSLGTSYGTGLQLYETDPGTGLQWTNSGLNAGEFGVKCVS